MIEQLLNTATVKIKNGCPIWENIDYINVLYNGHYGVSNNQMVLVLWKAGENRMPFSDINIITIVENIDK